MSKKGSSGRTHQLRFYQSQRIDHSLVLGMVFGAWGRKVLCRAWLLVGVIIWANFGIFGEMCAVPTEKVVEATVAVDDSVMVQTARNMNLKKREDLIEQAQLAMEKKKYARVIEICHELTEAGESGATIYYNLGVAYENMERTMAEDSTSSGAKSEPNQVVASGEEQKKNLGGGDGNAKIEIGLEALLSYRRAYLFADGDDEMRKMARDGLHRLEIDYFGRGGVLGKAENRTKTLTPKTFFGQSKRAFIADWAIVYAPFVIAILLMLWLRWYVKKTHKRASVWLRSVVIFGIGVALFIAALGAHMYLIRWRQNHQPRWENLVQYMGQQTLPVYAGMSVATGKIDQIYPGQLVFVEYQRGSWKKVKLLDGESSVPNDSVIASEKHAADQGWVEIAAKGHFEHLLPSEPRSLDSP